MTPRQSTIGSILNVQTSNMKNLVFSESTHGKRNIIKNSWNI